MEDDLPISQKVILHVDPQDLSGKTIVITGGNSGIGLECARRLAAMNPAKIILASRTMSTGEKAAQDIKNEIGFQNVEAWHLDQSSFASVQAFAKKYNESGLDLDILLANAGMLPFLNTGLESTSDGHEVV
jgi:NAD(P)-dependent dehydrogenase (short-subunit alcohol dehydrogenase family)